MAADTTPRSGDVFAPGSGRLRISLVSDEREVRRVLARIMRFAAHACDDEATLGAMQIVLAEVFNNITEHAYDRRPGNGVIRVTCTAVPGAFRFTVLDEGREIPAATLNKGACPQWRSGRQDLPEGGFGWHLIRSLSTNLTYTRRRGRNCLRFDIPTGHAASCTNGGI